MSTNTKIAAVLIAIIVVTIAGWMFMSKSKQPSQAQNQPLPIETQAPGKEFTVIGTPFKFDPMEIKVKQGDRVKITFKNEEGFHNLAIKDLNITTKNLQKGEQETIEFIADKTGTFQYNCSVPTHTEKGMVGNLVVE